jgi:hypothetical protein
MVDRIPQTVVAVPSDVASSATSNRASLPASAEPNEAEIPRSVKKLIDGLVNYFLRMDPPMNFDLQPSGIEVYTFLAAEGPGRYVYYSATPGMLHIFTPVGPTVPAEEDDAAVMAYLDGLTQTVPVPRVYESIARYEMNSARELGLYIMLPMPRTFSAVAVSDALWLIDKVIGWIESGEQV